MSRGHNRERAIKHLLQNDDWFVVRTAGSFGDADLIALKLGHKPRLIEVKSTAGGPYERFGHTKRDQLRLAAEIAGGEPILCWWPPNGQLHWIKEDEWPR